MEHSEDSGGVSFSFRVVTQLAAPDLKFPYNILIPVKLSSAAVLGQNTHETDLYLLIKLDSINLQEHLQKLEPHLDIRIPLPLCPCPSPSSRAGAALDATRSGPLAPLTRSAAGAAAGQATEKQGLEPPRTVVANNIGVFGGT